MIIEIIDNIIDDIGDSIFKKEVSLIDTIKNTVNNVAKLIKLDLSPDSMITLISVIISYL